MQTNPSSQPLPGYPSPQVLRYGTNQSMTAPIVLRAGPLTAIFEPDTTFLRHIRLADREVLLAIYSAVRDRNWATVPPVLSDLQVRQDQDTFEVTFNVRCRQGPIDFAWQGRIAGDPATIRYEMDGSAATTFLRNRLGFCVLHPMELAGQPCQIEKVDGRLVAGPFPRHIRPHQPFLDIRAIRHTVADGLAVEVRMEGDTFEMEDQRNWTDASFKTYCTPLALPMPVEVRAGTRVAQSVTVRVHGPAPSVEPVASPAPLTFTLGQREYALPRIGLGCGDHDGPLAPDDVRRLGALRLHHLRAELDLSSATWRLDLLQAAQQARSLDLPVELAVLLQENSHESLPAVAEQLRLWHERGLRIGTVLLSRRQLPADAQTIAAARKILADVAAGARFGTGSQANFTELNRNRPDLQGLDLLCYALNPQVHASDNASMVESLATQAVTLESARQFAGDLPLAVTPVTLRKRSRVARAADGQQAPAELPPSIDPRQMSLFAAGWTLGSLKYLAQGGADSVTYYETTGWRGVMETQAGSPLPDRFSSLPGAVFPVYHVLAGVAEMAGGAVLETISSDRLAVEGLALRQASRLRVMLGNLSAVTQSVTVRPLPRHVHVTVLDASNAQQAMSRPEQFRHLPGRWKQAPDGELVLTLEPCALARIDARL